MSWGQLRESIDCESRRRTGSEQFQNKGGAEGGAVLGEGRRSMEEVSRPRTSGDDEIGRGEKCGRVCMCPITSLSEPAIPMGVWSRCCRRGQASGEAIERGQRRHRLSGGGWHQRQRRKQRGLRCWIPVPPCAPQCQARRIDNVQTPQRHLNGVPVPAPVPAPSVGAGRECEAQPQWALYDLCWSNQLG